MGSIGLKVSKKGFDVKKMTYKLSPQYEGGVSLEVGAKLLSLIFNSSDFFLKNFAEGSGTFIIPASGEYALNGQILTSVPHNLGYRPNVVGYFSLDNVNWYPMSDRNYCYQTNVSVMCLSDQNGVIFYAKTWVDWYPAVTVYYKYVTYVDEL